MKTRAWMARFGVLAAVMAGVMAGGCSTGSDGSSPRVSGSGQLGASSPRSGAEATLDEVVGLMTGTFSSETQAQQNADFHPIVLHMTPIWTRFSANPAGGIGQKDAANPRRGHGLGDAPRFSERWMYVEQAVTTSAEKPYRQRVYRLTPLVYTDVNGVAQIGVRSEVWELPGDPLRYAGAWRSMDPLADIGPESLSLKDGCEVVLFRAADGTWRGSTVGDGCVSKRQGAAYTTSMVEITATGLRTLDRGFDAKGAQVWGSEHGAYVFDRVVK